MWFPCWQWRMLLPCYPECAEYLRVVWGLGCCSWTQWALGTQRRLETAAWPPEPEPGASHIPSRPGPTLPTHPLALRHSQHVNLHVDSGMQDSVWKDYDVTSFSQYSENLIHRFTSMSNCHVLVIQVLTGNKRDVMPWNILWWGVMWWILIVFQIVCIQCNFVKVKASFISQKMYDTSPVKIDEFLFGWILKFFDHEHGASMCLYKYLSE